MRPDRLFGAGRYQQGMDLLGEAARRGDADALEMLAGMALAGQIVERDLPLARDLFGRAAKAGSASAAATYRAFIANGTGGPPDWGAAMKLLDEAARSDPSAAREIEVIGGMKLGPEGEPLGPFPCEQLSVLARRAAFPQFILR